MMDAIRNGNFTSSGIVALATVDAKGEWLVAANTYIAETNMERYLDASLDKEFNSKETSWGKHVEVEVFDRLGISYTLCSDITDVHPTIPYWCGSKDGLCDKEGKLAVTDFKAPFTPKSFCQLILPLYLGKSGKEAMDAIRNGFKHNGFNYPKHIKGNTYYWQLVSNAIINNCTHAELIIYCPYRSELLGIMNKAKDVPDLRWMDYSVADIPFIEDDGFFKNINIIRFEIPQADKDFLTAQVEKAGKFLIERPVITE